MGAPNDCEPICADSTERIYFEVIKECEFFGRSKIIKTLDRVSQPTTHTGHKCCRRGKSHSGQVQHG